MNGAGIPEIEAPGSVLSVDFEIFPAANPATDAQRAALMVNPGFGRVFTDHMVTIRYADGKGWYDARVEARGPLMLDPATAVLHYAQEIFEGLKAYRSDGGGVTLFRPEANASRFYDSAVRLAMAPLPPELFLASLRELITIDREWVPTDPEGSLYLRPFMYASEAFLGVKPSSEYVYVLIASPVGSYFKAGLKPVKVWVSDEYTRAAPGGTGAAKCGGNYAASLAAHAEALENGCEQVVFLDAVHRRYVDEMGGMNVFVVYDGDTLVTPPLSGTILPGITRDSIMTLARSAGYTIVERLIDMDEWRADAVGGRATEAFACGTAAVITPIGEVRSREGSFLMGTGETGSVTAQLRQSLMDIQRGRAADPYGWVHHVMTSPFPKASPAPKAPSAPKASPAPAATTASGGRTSSKTPTGKAASSKAAAGKTTANNAAAPRAAAKASRSRRP